MNFAMLSLARPIWHYIGGLPWRNLARLRSTLSEDGFIAYLVSLCETPTGPPATPLYILQFCFWNSRSDLVRRAMARIAALRAFRDQHASVCFELMRLAEQSGSEAFLVEDVLAEVERLAAASMHTLLLAAVERARFGMALRQQRRTLPLVSLGHDCLPWETPNRWHVRDERQLAEIEGPFDLAAHSQQALPILLANDFADYSDFSSYGIIATAAGQDMALHKPTTSAFNHHLCGYWMKNDCAALMSFLRERVAALCAGFSNPSHLYLYHVSLTRTVEAAEQLMQDFAARSPSGFSLTNLPVILLNVDPSTKPHRQLLGERWAYLRVPRPDSEYVWYQAEDFSSPQGMSFERDILDGVLEFGKQLLP